MCICTLKIHVQHEVFVSISLEVPHEAIQPEPSNPHIERQFRLRRSSVNAIKKLSNVLWGVLSFFALIIGIFSLRYALPHIPHAAPLPNFRVNHRGLIVHAISASLALLLGPWQFLPGLRQRHPYLHRFIGRAYARSLLVAAISAIRIAPHAAAGHVSAAGFLSLAVGWLFTTSMGIAAIRRRDVANHRRWMIRSYALTAAAITLRIYLSSIPLFHFSFQIAYPAISWLCWVPNLLAAEVWIHWTDGAPYEHPIGQHSPVVPNVS
jgi:uncharacterized membrane protein